MHCYTTMQTVISKSIRCLSCKGRSLFITVFTKYRHSIPLRINSFFSIPLKYLCLRYGLWFPFCQTRFSVKFFYQNVANISHFHHACLMLCLSMQLTCTNKQRTHKHFISYINFQTRRYGALLRPTPCFHLLVSTNVSQSKISLDAGLFYMLSADEWMSCSRPARFETSLYEAPRQTAEQTLHNKSCSHVCNRVDGP